MNYCNQCIAVRTSLIENVLILDTYAAIFCNCVITPGLVLSKRSDRALFH